MRHERWRLMEQFEDIAAHGPVESGGLISKEQTRALQQARLIRQRRRDSLYVLTWRGRWLWRLWRRVMG